MLKKALLVSVSAALALTFVGCGGDSSSSSGVTKGVVVGSYYRNAKVCLDANNNGKCDAGEVSTITNDNGEYSLSGSNQAVVAEIGTTAVKYEPSSGVATPVTAPLVFRAPADAPTVISSITTLVVAKMDAGLSLAEAKSAVASEMGVPADKLMTDINKESDPTIKAALQSKSAQAISTIEKAVASGGDIKAALQKAAKDFKTYYALPASLSSSSSSSSTSSGSPTSSGGGSTSWTPFNVTSAMINNTIFGFTKTLENANQGNPDYCNLTFWSNGTVEGKSNVCDNKFNGGNWSISNGRVFMSKNATTNGTLEFLTSSGETLPTRVQKVNLYLGDNMSIDDTVYIAALRWNYGPDFASQYSSGHSFNITHFNTTGVTNYKFLNSTHANITWYTNPNGTLVAWDWTTDPKQLTLWFTDSSGVNNGTSFQNLSFEQNPMTTTGYIANIWGWLVNLWNTSVTILTNVLSTVIG